MTQSLKNFNIKYSCHCLTLWNKFFVHNTPNIEETDQHGFDLASRHPGFRWTLSPLFNPLFALPTCFRVILIYPNLTLPDFTRNLMTIRCSFFTSHIFVRNDTTQLTLKNRRAQNITLITIKLDRLVYYLVNFKSINFQGINVTTIEARNNVYITMARCLSG